MLGQGCRGPGKTTVDKKSRPRHDMEAGASCTVPPAGQGCVLIVFPESHDEPGDPQDWKWWIQACQDQTRSYEHQVCESLPQKKQLEMCRENNLLLLINTHPSMQGCRHAEALASGAQVVAPKWHDSGVIRCPHMDALTWISHHSPD